MFYLKYLTSEHLEGLKNYRYNVIDTNPVGKYILQPYLDFILQYVPYWMAPNLLTLVGFLFTASSFTLLSIFDYDFYASSDVNSIPRWVFLYVAVSVFINHTLDSLDGKQARRTGTSSPLGELLDHGLDSWTAFMIPSLLFSVFSRGAHGISALRLYRICWNIFFSFYMSHAEKYITGVLYLSWTYDYSMLGTVFLFLCTSIVGSEIWKITVMNFTFTSMLEMIFYASTLTMNIPFVIINIFNSYYYGTGRNLTFLSAVRPLWSFFELMGCCFLWIHASPSNIIETDPRVVFTITGTTFANICCRLIISQMSGIKCDIINWMCALILVNTVTGYLVPALEIPFTYCLLVVILLLHIHFGTCVIKQICEFFGINCFRVKLRDN